MNRSNSMTAQTLTGRTIIMSGGSSGIGLAMALRAAADGANVILLSKTALPHLDKSPNAHILTLSPPLDLDPKWAGSYWATPSRSTG
jgi:hypothetical protein